MKKTQETKNNYKKTVMLIIIFAMVMLILLPAKTSFAKSKSKIKVSKSKINLDVGKTGRIKATYKYSKDVKFKYKSDNTNILKINSKGKYKTKAPGIARVTIRAVKGKKTLAKRTVKIAVNGLCTDELSMEMGSFIYKGRAWDPGTLPLKVEKKLCLTQKDLKVYLTDYLPKYRKEISDPTEAALTAIANYGASYMKTEVYPPEASTKIESENFAFIPAMVGTISDAQNIWVYLIRDHKGACVYYSSLFSYLCYISGVSAMQIEDGGHDWNLLYYPGNGTVGGAYFNLDNHYLLCAQEDHFVAPPITNQTASIFGGPDINKRIIARTYLLPKSKMPVKKITKMGRDVSTECPLLMMEKRGNEYRVFFSKITKDNVPAFSDGTKITKEKLVYRNMELDADNDSAAPLFKKASSTLQDEVKDMMK